MNDNQNIRSRHIALIGFPGSGKSSTGRKLSSLLARPFIDTDVYIEQKTGLSVSRIFAEQGETRFRELESEILDEIARLPPSVIATGGGMPCFNNNMERIRQLGISVYLHAEPSTLCERLSRDAHRPLLAGKTAEQLHLYIKETLQVRAPYYEQAHILLDTFGKSETALAERIAKLVSVD